MHTPGTASYHKWLTPESFGKQFGPADEDVSAVETWLTGHGFSVTKVNPGKQTIEFAGNVGQFRNAFHAQIHKYVVNGETHYANTVDPQIPAALAPVVGGFVSLNNFRAKSYLKPLGAVRSKDRQGDARVDDRQHGGLQLCACAARLRGPIRLESALHSGDQRRRAGDCHYQ
jgi:subtilase family serine protease